MSGQNQAHLNLLLCLVDAVHLKVDLGGQCHPVKEAAAMSGMRLQWTCSLATYAWLPGQNIAVAVLLQKAPAIALLRK
jgi:hypothetical protein